MVTIGPHYHFSTGHDSKNRGGFYLCQNIKTDDCTHACCLEPVFDEVQLIEKES